jgi:hypothetical protein
VVQPTYDDFYVPQGSSTNITNSFLRVVVTILTTNVSGKEIVTFLFVYLHFNVFGCISPSVFRMSVFLPRSCQNVFLFTLLAPSGLFVYLIFTRFLCSVRFNDESHVIYFFVPDFFVLVL